MNIRSLLLAFALALFVLAGCSSDEPDASSAPKARVPAQTGGQTTALEEPQRVPDLTLTTTDGNEIALTERHGEVLLLNFWATWCAPCRKEIPDLIELQEEFGDDGLTVVGIAMDKEGEEVVQPYAEEQQINYPIVLDTDASISQQFDEVYGLPTTIVVGPDGNIHYRILGLFPTEEMRPKLAELLKQGAETQQSG